jgi:hypothetical protein
MEAAILAEPRGFPPHTPDAPPTPEGLAPEPLR